MDKMVLIQVTISVTSVLIGAWVGTYLSRLFMKSKPKIMATYCELSNKIYALVDHIEVPLEISEKMNRFRWATYDRTVYNIPSGATLLPIGVAQGSFDFLKIWEKKAENAEEKLQNALKLLGRIHETNKQEIKEPLQNLFEDVLITQV